MLPYICFSIIIVQILKWKKEREEGKKKGEERIKTSHPTT